MHRWIIVAALLVLLGRADSITTPTAAPTAAKSVKPTKHPTPAPTEEPTAFPTFAPTISPTRTPSAKPSHYPSKAPTAIPSVSFYPTSMPTANDLPRYYQCSDLVCQGNSATDCYYTTGNVVLECVDEFTPCELNTASLIVGPNTALTVSGGCELIVSALSGISIKTGTTFKAASMSLTARKDINIHGHISTNGQGPLDGPGAPNGVDQVGWGGSYGGSGGRLNCNDDYFSNLQYQLGSINVLDDTDDASPNYNATFGSGGGFDGAGRGGGRVVLKATGNVIVQSSGIISADGSPPDVPQLGAGSGGSITISATQCVQRGLISAKGGNAVPHVGTAGAAGGGGRIAIIVAQLNMTASSSYTNLNTNIDVAGGRYDHKPCRAGAAGTAYVQLGHGGIHLFNAALLVGNDDRPSMAVTMLDTVPSAVNVMSISSGAVITSQESLSLLPLPSCIGNQPSSTACSIIYIVNASFVALSNSSDSYSSFDGTIWGITADEVNIINSRLSGLAYSRYSFNITALTVAISANSSILYSRAFTVHAEEFAQIMGDIVQVPGKNLTNQEDSYFHRAYLSILAAKNVTIGNVVATNMKVIGNHVNFLTSRRAGSPPGFLPQACQSDISLDEFTCNRHQYMGRLKYNNTYVLIGNSSINVGDGALMEAAQVLFCAPNITIGSGAAVSANERGCEASHGVGAGGVPSALDAEVPNGGGGAGYGGVGGYGYDAAGNGGQSYDISGKLYSGSGGGCLNCTESFNGAGGGIINFVANDTLILNGNLTANGGFGISDAGGGSGGTVYVDALAMSGKGYISVSGGSGGSGKYPGGGGGGGVLKLFNTKNYYLSYNYVGVVSASGGQAGHPLLTGGDAAVVYPQAMLKSKASNREKGRYIRPYDDDAAVQGQDGVLDLPACPPGYGNGVSTGTVCGLCPAGTYSPGDGKNICYQCDNKPVHSSYTNTGWGDSDCPYTCNTGYSTSDCYTPFENFIFHTLGVLGLVFCSVGIFGIILLPLVYYRYKKEYSWYEDHRKVVLPTDTFARVDAFRTHERTGRLDRKFTDAEQYDPGMVQNPMDHSIASIPSEVSEDLSKVSSAAASQSTALSMPKTFQRMNRDLRLRFRLVEPDLVQHACRVNFFGSNHPDPERGGQWKLPVSRPACLRPMLRRAEYKEFAEKVNKRMEWQPFGIEMLTFYTVAFVAPPLAAFLMRQFRKRRGNLLLKIIANYDYACFRCPIQRQARNALRIGISPDATLAYIDFLYDEEKSQRRMKPLCPQGQVRLPASFKLAGLGTYCTPFYVDTNDLILQAVPQTDIPSSFINEAWISFVVELNTILRTVQADALYFGIRRLIRFLSEEQHSTNLGGLVVEFCTFPNIETVPASERDEAPSEEILAKIASASQQASTSKSTPQSASSSRSDQRNNSWERWIMKQRTSEKAEGPRIPEMPALHDEMDRNSSKELQQSVDLAFTSPQVSLDMRESMVIKSQKKVLSCCGYVCACVSYMFHMLVICFCMCGYNNSHSLSDPVGYALSFIEMCDAIRQGKLKMGIIVTHPKVVACNYIVQDEDYESDDDDFYQDETRRDTHLQSMDSASQQSNSLHSVPANIFSAGVETSDSKAVVKSSSSKTNSALRRTYGDKAEEVARFYNIMLAADNSMAAANKGAAGTTAAKSPPVSAASSPVQISTLTPMTLNWHADNLASATKQQGSPRRVGIAAESKTDGAAADKEEYTDLSPHRALRRHSKSRPSTLGVDRESTFQNPRSSDVDTSFEGRMTGDTAASEVRFESFADYYPDRESHQTGHRVSDDSRDSRSVEHEEDKPAGDVTDRNTGGEESQFSHSRSINNTPNVTPTATDRRSMGATIGKHKKRGEKRRRKDLSTENLAYSAFQHPVNAWRLNESQEFVSDGLLRIQEREVTRSESNVSLASGSMQRSSADGSDVSGNRMNFLSVEAKLGDTSKHGTKSPLSRTPTNASRPTSKSPWYDIRTFMGAASTSSKNPLDTSVHRGVSFATENRSARSEVMSMNSSDAGSVVANDNASDGYSDQGKTVRDVEVGVLDASMDKARESFTHQQAARRRSSRKLTETASGFQFSYLGRLMLFYMRSFMLGSNIYPVGPKYIRNILEILIFVLCIIDIALSIIVLVSAYCASHDTTACTDHTSMILIVTVWPGALTIAPIMGLAMVILGPSGTLARMYALWSRIAGINSAMVIWSLVYYYDYFYTVEGSFYAMLTLPSSRAVQCVVVDLYIAHIEKLRYTRGWDGLHTSLFKTQDNLQEIMS